MQVKFLDLDRCHSEISTDIDQVWQRVTRRNHYILGPELTSFEEEFAQYNSLSFAAGVANGLDAIVLLLKACGVGKGDEVIVPAHTFIATWLAVTQVGASLVPVDVEEDSFNINHNKVIQKLSPRTKAIIAVNLYGRRSNLEKLSEICLSHKISLIVDAAQSHGAPTIALPYVHFAYSFYPGKNLGCFGDGGAIVSNNIDIINKVKMLRNYGSVEKYVHTLEGVNSRLDEIQAAILSIKLKRLDQWNSNRRKAANLYIDGLKDIPGLVLPTLPVNTNDHVWHLFVIRTQHRNELRNYLSTKGIDTMIHYPTPPYLQDAYKHLDYKADDFPIATKVSNELLSLPIGSHISNSKIEYTITNVKTYFGE